MSQLRSPKVRKIIGLRGQAARLRSRYQAALEQTAVLQHRASRLDQEARALKGTLTDCELRRAWSGV